MRGDDLKDVAVVGAGLMGHGIAMEFALHGLNVRLNDVSDKKLDEALSTIRNDLNLLSREGLVTKEQCDIALQNIRLTTVLEDAAIDTDLVIEAASENLELKRSLFARLDAICPQRTVLSSNTSTFLPSSLASATQRPAKVLVTHYFNPPFLLPLVEVVRGEHTSAETVDVMVEFLKKMGKTPAIVQKEVPGFIGNRLQIALLREALSLVEQGVATPQDVDIVIKSSFGRRLSAAGVFEIFEIAGWDLIEQIAKYLLPDISSSAAVPAVLSDKVKAGELGVKSGKGFYEWTPAASDALRMRIADALIAIQKRDRIG